MTSDVGPSNIVDQGVRRRQRLGVAWLIAGVLAAAILILGPFAREWRLLLFIPFTISANGFLQARERTCIILAALGKREVKDGRSFANVPDDERGVFRRRALMIAGQSALIAAALTAAIWWIG